MPEEISRQELYDAIDRQNEHLERVIMQGFEAVNRRLDIANGRTSKLEDRQQAMEKTVAVLEDRAATATKAASASRAVASNSKWWATSIAGVVVAIVEAVKMLLN